MGMTMKDSSRRASRPRGCRGFSLLEALIAILIFAIGVIGLIGLQASLIKSATGTDFRATAGYLASEARGLMWVDIGMIDQYDTSASCPAWARCKAWTDKVAANLPNGVGQIDVASGDATITITWTPPGEETHNFVTVTSVNP